MVVAGWVWWIAAGLTFTGTLLIGAGAAYGREWPSRLLDFTGMVIGIWGVGIALVCGLIELGAWLL